jgi:uncharacterized protein (TIGR00369 family)
MQKNIDIDPVMEKINAIPVVSAMKMGIEMLTKDVVRVKVPHDPAFDGVFDTFHGGMLMTVADTISCFLIIKRNGPDIKIATTDMNIRFLSPCTTDVIAEGRFIKAGRTLNMIEVDLYDTAGKKVAIAQVTYIRVDQLQKKTGSERSVETSAEDDRINGNGHDENGRIVSEQRVLEQK